MQKSSRLGLVIILQSFLILPVLATTSNFSVVGCPENITKQFLDISLAPGAGAGDGHGLKPSLEVNCDMAANTMTVVSNAIPHFTFNQTAPNALRAQKFKHTVSLKPQIAREATKIGDLNNGANVTLGYIGFTVTGLPIFGPTEAAIPPDSAFGDPVYNCLLGMPNAAHCSDKSANVKGGCGGHTATIYHQHYIVESCFNSTASLVAEPWKLAQDSSKPSPIIGYAADGFPIYGNLEYDNASGELIALQSSYELKPGQNPESLAWESFNFRQHADMNHYLDECNGHTDSNGNYHYHTTPTFPYIIGCFRGKPSEVHAQIAVSQSDKKLLQRLLSQKQPLLRSKSPEYSRVVDTFHEIVANRCH